LLLATGLGAFGFLAPVFATQSEAEVAYTRALLALHQGDADSAESLLRQALAEAPGHGGAHYELARLLLARGEREAGLRELKKAKRSPIAPPVSPERLAEDLRRAEGLTAGEPLAPPVYGTREEPLSRLPRWEARLGLQPGVDSNPAALPEEGAALGPGGEVLRGAESDAGAFADLRFEVHPFYGRGGWSLGLGADLRRSFYGDLSQAGLGRLKGFVQLAWGDAPAGLVAGPLGFTRVPLGNRRWAILVQATAGDESFDGDRFRDTFELGLAGTFRESRATATQVDLLYQDRELASGVSNSSLSEGELTAVRLSQYLYLGSHSRYFRFAYLAGQRDGPRPFEADLEEARAELVLPLGPRLGLMLLATWDREEFSELESNPLFPTFFGDQPREDTRLRGFAVATLALRRDLFLVGRLAYLDRETDLGAADSLQDLDLDRSLISVGVRWFAAGGGGR
jgi:hypothetical protein